MRGNILHVGAYADIHLRTFCLSGEDYIWGTGRVGVKCKGKFLNYSRIIRCNVKLLLCVLVRVRTVCDARRIRISCPRRYLHNELEDRTSLALKISFTSISSSICLFLVLKRQKERMIFADDHPSVHHRFVATIACVYSQTKSDFISSDIGQILGNICRDIVAHAAHSRDTYL